MSDHKLDSTPQPLPEPQTTSSAVPPAQDQLDTIRSAFNQQEDAPKIEEEPSSGIGGFFRNLKDVIKETLGIGEEKTAAESNFQIGDLDLLPMDEENPVEEDQELEAGFAFIEQERLELSEQNSPRIAAINIPSEISTGAVEPKTEPGAATENVLLSAEESLETSNRNESSEDELDLEAFLPKTTVFSNENSKPAFTDSPDNQENHPFPAPTPTPQSEENSFELSEGSSEKKVFSKEDLKTFLTELDNKDTETSPLISPEGLEVETLEDWNAPLASRPTSNNILEKEIEFEELEQDSLLHLRSMFDEEDMNGSEEEEDFARIHPRDRDKTIPLRVDLDQSPSEENFPDVEPSFNITEEEIEALNPEDFLPESILRDSATRVFVFKNGEDKADNNKPASSPPESEHRDQEQDIEPFSHSSESGSYFDNLRSVLKSDEDDLPDRHDHPESVGDLASVSKQPVMDQKEETPDGVTSFDTARLSAGFDEEYENAPQLLGIESQESTTILARIRNSLSKWSNKEKLLIGTAVLFGLLVFSTIALITINSIFLPFFNTTRLPGSAAGSQETQAEVVDPSIYPVSLKLPGGWVFSLQESTMKTNRWEPVTAEYLRDATIRRIVAIPWSKQTEAVISTFEKGDELLLFMNNNDIKGYKVEEVKTVPQEDTSILVDTAPSLVVILYNPDAASRWVVFCKP